MAKRTAKAGAESPATSPVTAAQVREALKLYFYEAIEPNGFGVEVVEAMPVRVTWRDETYRCGDHTSMVRQIKAVLEDVGYDVATRGAPGADWFAVFGHYTEARP